MKVPHKIKVLIVDDSLVFRETLAKEIAKDFGIEVVGTAGDPYEARDRILELKPNVVTLDVEMPKMGGIDFLRQLMPQYPLPVIVVSSSGNSVFEALDAGAVDFVLKPDTKKPGGLHSFINELVVKIKIASTAKVGSYKKDYQCPAKLISNHGTDISGTVVAIGASTGGTEAIYSIITALPRDMPGILIVQHMPPVFTRLYAERLNNSCMLEVKEAKNGDEVKPGRVLVAPGDYHMRLARSEQGYFVKCAKGERVNGHCPSVDVLFDSVAETAKEKAVGVILTGMGADGAKGILNMRKKGAYTIGQDEKTSVVYGMPMVAFNIGGIVKQLPLDKIAQEICNYLSL
ncbi:MAG: chemotaxis response regulator protein-glutamate methylesterase [Eubacteriales bacterium]|nr:chemotaxis response regulator protein-glutamate methylesterase [Eubacteriales bacterium]